MTTAQRIAMFATWWKAACENQGWDPNDRQRRLSVISEAVGRPVESSADLNNTTDIDRVKARFLVLADDLQGAIEEDHPEVGEKRRLIHKIRFEQSEALRALGVDGARYIEAVCVNKFHTANYDGLPLFKLKQLMMTVAARLCAKRSEDRGQKPEDSQDPQPSTNNHQPSEVPAERIPF